MSCHRLSLLKKIFYFHPLLLAYSTLMALPEGGEVVMGEVEFHSPEPHLLRIKTSDKSILKYRKFNIGEKEHVRFVQPSSQSTVLTRIQESEPSKILGQLSANGRIFLVNPNGIYFGPDSIVNTGSLVASTLDIRDEDFLNDRFHFYLKTGFEQAKILNAGTLSASEEGFVALFAPSIENQGSVFAKAGKVFLASGETVTVDFSADGFMQFVVEGDLEQGIIENYGRIEAVEGSVQLSLRSAKDMLEMVINTDGMMPANEIAVSNGIIRLVSSSRISASKVEIESNHGKVDVRGKIDVSNTGPQKQGGGVHILGEQIRLASAAIDATGDFGGGVVLIGGDYQGKGELRTSRYTSMDSASRIYADAYGEGNGGKVVLWADDTTLFNGKIFARGNGESGSGGLVETSGKKTLIVQEGSVDTSAPSGIYGNWLLDPNTITVAIGGGGSLPQVANCSSTPGITISPAMIASSTTNVILCAQKTVDSSITIANAITITKPNVSLSLIAGSTGLGAINLNNNLTTAGSSIHLIGTVNLGANVNLDTTYAGKANTGGDISFSNTVDGARILTINSGTMGTVSMGGPVGGATPLTSLTALAATIEQSSTAETVGALTYTATNEIAINGNVTTSGGAIYMRGPVVLANNPIFDSTNNGASPKGASIRFGSSVDGSTLLTLQAGNNGNVLFAGPVGDVDPLINLAFVSGNILQIGSNITVTGTSPLIFPNPVNLTGSSHITSNHANVIFNAAIDGDKDLRITGGNGEVVFAGTIGEGISLASLTVVADTVTQSSTAQIAGPFSFTAANAINIHGNITTTGGTVDMTGSIFLAGPLVFDTTNGGTLPGAHIRFSGTLDGTDSLMLAAGTSGDICFLGVVGGTNPLNDLLFISANTIQTGSHITVTGANPLTFPNPVLLIGETHIASNQAHVSFNSTLDGDHGFTLLTGSGSAVFLESIGQNIPLTSLNVTANTDIHGNIMTKGGPIHITGSVMLSANSIIDTTNGGEVSNGADIVFLGPLDGFSELALKAGSAGNISLTGPIGQSMALANLTASASIITQQSIAQIAGFVHYEAGTAIGIGGDIRTSAAPIRITGPVLLENNPALDTTNHGALTGADIIFSAAIDGATALKLQAGTIGNISFAGAIGLEDPPVQLTAVGSMITQNSTVNLVDFLNYEAAFININGNITTSSGLINMTGPVMLSADSLLDTTNGGANPLGADIRFSDALDGDQSLTLLSGGKGKAAFEGALGAATALASLIVEAAETSIHGDIITNGGIVHITGPVTLEVASVINTTNAGKSPAGANITFLNAINGNQELVLIGGSEGVISIVEAGGINPLASIAAKAQTVEIQGNITTRGGIIDVIGSALLVNSPTFDTTDKGSLPGANIRFSDVIDGPATLTLYTGSETVNFGGAVGSSIPLAGLTVAAGSIVQDSTLHIENFLNYTAAVEIKISGNIITNAGPIHMIGPLVLAKASTIDTTNKGANPSGGDIAFSKAINGSQILMLVGGNEGSVSLARIGDITPLQSLTAVGKIIEVQGNITTVGGTIDMAGPVVLANSPVFDSTGGSTYGANIRFSDTIDGATDLTLQAGTSGSVSFIGAVGGTSPLTDLFFAGVNTIEIGSNITVTGSNPLILPKPVVLRGPSRITSRNADISFGSHLDGNESLTLLAGNGTTTFIGPIGKTVPLMNLTVEAAAIAQGNTARLSSFLHYVAAQETKINGNITTSGGAIEMRGPVMLTTASIIDTTNAGACPEGSDIAFSGMINGYESLLLIGGSEGVVSLAEMGNMTALSSFAASGRSIEINGNISTGGGTIDMMAPVMLLANSSLDATDQGRKPLGANILFASSVDGSADLMLQAGRSGNVNFLDKVGALIRIGDLTINTVNDLSTTSLAARSILMNSSRGIATFNGALDTTGAAGVRLIGNVIHQLGGVVTENGGYYTITNADTFLVKGAAVNSISGSYTQNGVGPVYCEGFVSIETGDVLFSSPVTLLGKLTLSTESSGGDITFLNTVDGTQDLTLIAGTGSIHLKDNLGQQTPLGTFTIDSATGIYTSRSVRASSISIGTLGGTAIDFVGALIADVAGIDLYSPLNFVGNSSFDTSLSNGNIHFFKTIDGAFSSTFTAGAGNIFFDAAVGNAVPLSGFILGSAHNVMAAGTISAGSIVQTTGSGKTTYARDLFTTDLAGIFLTGSEFELSGAITTKNSGSFLINNSGCLNISLGGKIAGGLMQTGSGSAILAGSMSAAGPISFASPVTLTGAASLDTSISQSNITFLSAVDGPYDLTLNLGEGGDLTLIGNLGDTSRLGAMTIIKARHVLASNITAASLTQTSGSGLTKLGNVNTNEILGVSLSGNALSIEGNLITTHLGTVTLDHSGPLVLLMGPNTSITGAFKQSGDGPVSLAGNLATLDKDLLFTKPVSLIGPTSLSTGKGVGTITFSGSLDLTGFAMDR